MTTIILDYDIHNPQAKKALDSPLSMGFVKEKPQSKKKTGLERAFEDIENGRVTFVNGPKKQIK